jgi:hypothetical protein
MPASLLLTQYAAMVAGRSNNPELVSQIKGQKTNEEDLAWSAHFTVRDFGFRRQDPSQQQNGAGPTQEESP